MKKWLIALCCIVLAGAVAFVTVINNKQGQIDTLNKDLSDVQAENNTLKEQGEKDAQSIQDLNKQVEDLTAERDTLTAERDTLTAENGKLTETLDGMNRNLTASQQKMQGILYIMTDGAQGSIESVLSPYMKIYGDVGVDNPYFEAVDYVTDNRLMEARGEETFGVAEPATLGEMADGLYRIQGKTGTQEEAVAALLETEKAWIAAQMPAEEAPAEEAAAEETAEEAPAEEAAAEETAEEAPATEEAAEATPAEEAVTEETAEEAPAEEAAAEETAEEAPAEEAAAEEAPAEEAPAAEEAAAEEAPAEEASAEEAPAEEASAEETAEEAPGDEAVTEETPAEENVSEAPAEDGTTILTRERLTALCQAICGAEKEAPAIAFPDAESAEATRGDLAMVLQALDQMK